MIQRCVAAAVALAAAVSTACAGEMSEAAMQDWIASATPAGQHARLAKLAGRWKVHQRDWMDAGAPWNEADGTATWQPVLGGRFMQQELATTLKGHPYHGLALIGFHRESGKYVAAWMDDYGTSLLRLEGDWDEAGRTLALTGYLGPEGDARARWTMKQVWRDDDHMTVEWWGPTASGASAKMVEVEYARLNPASPAAAR